MAQKTSAVLITLGVLHLVGGGLGLIGTTCSGVGLVISATATTLPNRPKDDIFALRDYLVQTVPAYQGVEIFQLVTSFLFDITLLAAGIGLLQRQHWARIASLIWAVLSILSKIFNFCYLFLFVNPAATTFVEQRLLPRVAPAQQAGFSIGFKASYFGSVCLQMVLIVYPIVVLILLLLPSVAAQFRRKGDGYRKHSLDDRDEDDRYR